MIFLPLGYKRNPVFRHSRASGMTKGGGSVGKFESQERKKTDLFHVLLKIEPFKNFCKRLQTKAILRIAMQKLAKDLPEISPKSPLTSRRILGNMAK
jgi:hypothetical protein